MSWRDKRARWMHRLQHTEHFVHMGYFGLVFFHGPYEWAAGVLLITGLVLLAWEW